MRVSGGKGSLRSDKTALHINTYQTNKITFMMKKTLLLITILPFLLIGFVSCNENTAIEEDVDWSVVDPWGYFTIKGELFFNQNDGVYYFTATENGDNSIIKKLRESSWPIFRGSSEYLSLDMSCVGNVTAKIVPEFKDSIMIREIIPEKASKSGFLTPELDTPPPTWFFEPMSRASFNLNGRYEVINVFVHVVLDSSGNIPWTIDKDYMTTEVINTLNRYHGMNTHIFFRAIGNGYVNFITSSFDFDKDYYKVFNQKHVDGALNIYIPYKNYYDAEYAGAAKDIISDCCIIQLNSYDTSALIHETGHCFGLYHTHKGTAALWKQYNKDNENGIAEFVDGSNSANAGDYITDTPADPRIWEGGEYYGDNYNIVDGHGDKYHPDQYNMMSYSHNGTQRFSPLQIERMHQTLSNESVVSKMAVRQISPTAEELGGPYIGGLHFSERTKTLTFPVAAEDEVVTWTISRRSGSSGDTSQASPQVTKKTGKSITIDHTSPADYFEVYATTITPSGKERKSEVWKATAGVPSAAVGTLSWTGGNTSGSFPGYSPTLVLPNYDTSLDLKYTDLANPISRQGITYRLYTSAGGMMESTWGDFCISEMDISRGYVEVQAVDNCCGEGMRWRIECQSKWDIFSLDVKDGQLMIDVKPATAQAATAEKASAKRNLTIKSIKLTTPEGRELVGRTLDTPQRKMSLSTSGMPKGQYLIEITDVDGKVHKGHFGI